MHLPWEKGLPSISPGWNYPGQASQLLEIRPLKTTGATTEDTEMENCPARQNLLLQKGVQVHWHSKHKEQGVYPPFYS
jgi:hypothetical protein